MKIQVTKPWSNSTHFLEHRDKDGGLVCFYIRGEDEVIALYPNGRVLVIPPRLLHSAAVGCQVGTKITIEV